jgi:hypothetical protein
LDENPEILDRVHQDLKKLSQRGCSGRNADFTSETILRGLAVHAVEGLALRETAILIAGSDSLQDFLRTRKKAALDSTFLDKRLSEPSGIHDVTRTDSRQRVAACGLTVSPFLLLIWAYPEEFFSQFINNIVRPGG